MAGERWYHRRDGEVWASLGWLLQLLVLWEKITQTEFGSVSHKYFTNFVRLNSLTKENLPPNGPHHWVYSELRSTTVPTLPFPNSELREEAWPLYLDSHAYEPKCLKCHLLLEALQDFPIWGNLNFFQYSLFFPPSCISHGTLINHHILLYFRMGMSSLHRLKLPRAGFTANSFTNSMEHKTIFYNFVEEMNETHWKVRKWAIKTPPRFYIYLIIMAWSGG